MSEAINEIKRLRWVLRQIRDELKGSECPKARMAYFMAQHSLDAAPDAFKEDTYTVQEQALACVPDGYSQVTEGCVQVGDMCWREGFNTWKEIDQGSVQCGNRVAQCYCVIRKKG